MARSARIDFSGAWHHVMHRGARREHVFRDDYDRRLLMESIAESVKKFGFEVHAYALLMNHYHLLVRSIYGNLSRCMQHVNGRFVQRLNHRHAWDGPVFRGRFRSKLVTLDGYLRYLVAYIHLNPLRHDAVAHLEARAWTSHRAYIGLERPPAWLRTSYMLETFGSARAMHRFVLDMHRGVEPWPDGLELGMGLIAERDGGQSEEGGHRDHADGVQKQDASCVDFPSADEIVRRVLAVTEAEFGDLERNARGRGGNPVRRFAIWALDDSTMLSHREIGAVLRMTPSQVTVALHRLRNEPAHGNLDRWKTRWRLADASRDR